MSHKKHKRHRRKANNSKMEDIPMTPMIDIVFQLLVFFVWTYELPPTITNLQVFRPAAPEKQTDLQKLDSMRIGVYTHGFTMNDRRVSDEQMEDMLFRMADLNKSQTIIIMNTPNAPHRQTMTVLDLCAKAELTTISLLSTE